MHKIKRLDIEKPIYHLLLNLYKPKLIFKVNNDALLITITMFFQSISKIKFIVLIPKLNLGYKTIEEAIEKRGKMLKGM